MRTLASALACALALVCARASAQGARPRPFPALPLAITVALEGGAPVVEDAWIEAQVRRARAIFAPTGVRFRVVARRTMGASHARLEDRRDRHALGRLLRPGRIEVFVVRSLRDVDDPSRMRQGVHWRPRGPGIREGAHLVILSAVAGPTVLAHELGHFFGNPHSPVAGNIMSYLRGAAPPSFDGRQRARIRASVRRALRRGELLPADEISPRPPRAGSR